MELGKVEETVAESKDRPALHPGERVSGPNLLTTQMQSIIV